MSLQLLRHAWDTLDTFKQVYPENWNEEDEQLMKDLIRADLDLSGVKRPWVGLTDDEYIHITDSVFHSGQGLIAYYKAIEAKLKEKNNGN
jgi:hypothetical protein